MVATVDQRPSVGTRWEALVEFEDVEKSLIRLPPTFLLAKTRRL
jgi:hypothetical protein